MRHGAMSRCQCVAAALAAVMAYAPVRAQGVSPLEPGTRVRVFSPSIGRDGLIGNLLAVADDTLSIRPENRADTVRLVRSELTRLEQSTGRHSHALRFAGIGLLVGAAGGAITSKASGDDKKIWWGGYSPRQDAVAMGIVGFIVGGVIGGNFPTEDWAPLQLHSGSRISVTPRIGRQATLAYVVTFE